MQPHHLLSPSYFIWHFDIFHKGRLLYLVAECLLEKKGLHRTFQFIAWPIRKSFATNIQRFSLFLSRYIIINVFLIFVLRRQTLKNAFNLFCPVNLAKRIEKKQKEFEFSVKFLFFLWWHDLLLTTGENWIFHVMICKKITF